MKVGREIMNVKKETIIRSALLILSIINAGLALCGKSPLPFDDRELTNAISYVWAGAMSLWAWWKNNSFTSEAIEADRYLVELKEKNKE